MNSESSTVDWKGCFATRVEAAAEIFDDIEAFASRTCLNSDPGTRQVLTRDNIACVSAFRIRTIREHAIREHVRS